VENTVRKYITLTTLDELSSDSSSESSISDDESDISEDMEPTPGPGIQSYQRWTHQDYQY